MNDRDQTPIRRRRRLKWLLWAIILEVAGYFLWVPVERGIIALTIRNAHIFREPSDLAGESWRSRNREAAGARRRHAVFDAYLSGDQVVVKLYASDWPHPGQN